MLLDLLGKRVGDDLLGHRVGVEGLTCVELQEAIQGVGGHGKLGAHGRTAA